MIPLPLPIFDASQVIEKILSKMPENDLRQKLKESALAVTAAEKTYAASASARQLWKFPTSDNIGLLANAEIVGIYKERMSKKNSAAFSFYSDIKGLAPHDRCPLCGVGVVSSVDHHLPKSRFTSVGLTPLNLVPACNDCNKNKHTRFARNLEDQTIHPYFDNFSNHAWIRGRVLEEINPAVLFSVDSQGAYSKTDEEILKRHFSVMKFHRLYASNASSQLPAEREALCRITGPSKASGVKAHLDEQYRIQKKLQLNSWKTAFYEALSASEWFIQGGFMTIPA